MNHEETSGMEAAPPRDLRPLSVGSCSWCGLDHPDGPPRHMTDAGHPFMRSHPTRGGFVSAAEIGGRLILNPGDPSFPAEET